MGASNFGRFAEWLGAGLQNQLQRFESATDLHIKTELSDNKEVRFFRLPFWRTVGVFYENSLISQICERFSLGLVISVFGQSLVNIILSK